MNHKKKKGILIGLIVLLVAFLIWPRKNSLGIENGTYTGGFDDRSYITIYGDYFIWTGDLYYHFKIVKENVVIIGKIEENSTGIGIIYTGVKEAPHFVINHATVWGSEDKGYKDMFVIAEEVNISNVLPFYKK